MRTALSVAGLLALSTTLGAVRLAIDPEPFDPTAAALVALGALVLTLVSVTGFLVGHSRWSRLTGTGLAALWVGLVAAKPIDPLGMALLVSATAAGAGHGGVWGREWARRLPSTDAPPVAAVAAILTLLATPAIVGLAQADRLHPTAWALAGWSVALAWALTRAWRSGLWAVRVAHPIAAVAAAVVSGLPGGPLIAVWSALPAAAAWHPAVTEAFRSLDPAHGVPIPPELAPDSVMEAAGADDTGRQQT